MCRGQAQGATDLLALDPLDVDQQHHQPLALGEPAERLLDPPQLLPGDGGPLKILVRRRGQEVGRVAALGEAPVVAKIRIGFNLDAAG